MMPLSHTPGPVLCDPQVSMSDGHARTVDALLERLARRVRAEYLEMPGLQLTAAQAARFLGVDHAQCARLLGELVAEGFLFHSGGRYLRTGFV